LRTRAIAAARVKTDAVDAKTLAHLLRADLGARRSRPEMHDRQRPAAQQFEPIAKRRGRKIAKVAVARQILTLSYYGLRDGEIRCLARRSRASAKEQLAAAA